jgi:hypothetical protein
MGITGFEESAGAACLARLTFQNVYGKNNLQFDE